MVLAEPKKTKLSRRQKIKAQRSLEKVVNIVVEDIRHDQFLRNHLFLEKPDQDTLRVGVYTVKRENEMYNFYKHNYMIHSKIYAFDAAMAIVEALNIRHKDRAQEILGYESAYARNMNDMRFFQHSYAAAIESDPETAEIYATRYNEVKGRAEQALKKIRSFRLVRKN